MAKQGLPNTIWVSVLVQSGIPVEVKAFRDSRSAQVQRNIWLRDVRPEYDEAGVFEVAFPSEVGVEDCVERR